MGIRLSFSPHIIKQGIFLISFNFSKSIEVVVKLYLGESAEVDIDDGQRRGSFGREIGVVYCDGKNLNEQLMDNNLGIIDTGLWKVRIFKWEMG